MPDEPPVLTEVVEPRMKPAPQIDKSTSQRKAATIFALIVLGLFGLVAWQNGFAAEDPVGDAVDAPAAEAAPAEEKKEGFMTKSLLENLGWGSDDEEEAKPEPEPTPAAVDKPITDTEVEAETGVPFTETITPIEEDLPSDEAQEEPGFWDRAGSAWDYAFDGTEPTLEELALRAKELDSRETDLKEAGQSIIDRGVELETQRIELEESIKAHELRVKHLAACVAEAIADDQ